MYICIYVYIRIYIYNINVYVCVYIYIHIYIVYIHTYMYIYAHIHQETHIMLIHLTRLCRSLNRLDFIYGLPQESTHKK